MLFFFFKQKTAYEMRISDGVQTCALPICRGRYIAVTWFKRLLSVADFPEPVGPNRNRWAFICRSNLFKGSNVIGPPPRLNIVMPGCPVPWARPHTGDTFAMCCANISWVYHLRRSWPGL